ncbi:MAG: response regulator transcription factor [Defluviitaleaceae bacterium]|nr:response regulator transcription factor [Defluviitaleaceae bacterium]MCL2837399.1 response regulator transcription factor [Defluviitaleaceae bacterium]
MKKKRILLVEDNEEIMYGNVRMFEMEGYETAAALTLAAARDSIGKRRPDAIVLDVLLPDGSGLDFMNEIRKNENAGIPIILLTSLSTKADILHGLRVGGDDYLTKPYDFDELLARVEALLRLAARMPESIIKGALTLDLIAGKAFLNGSDLLLSQKEFSLLLLFAQCEGEIINAETIYEKLWKAPILDDRGALEAAISKLRKKIALSGYEIFARRGQGYIFRQE